MELRNSLTFFLSLSVLITQSTFNQAQNNFENGHDKTVNVQAPGSFRSELMYPYNLSDFTEITSIKPIHYQRLPFRLPFFGFDYHYITVQRDGYLSFNKGLLAYKFPVKLPIIPRDNFLESDPSMIAPWFALQDIPTEVPYAGIYLRMVNLETEHNVTLRDRIRADFREGMIGAEYFTPKFALIITWRNMTMINRRPEMPLVTNTYQCVLATDEIRTYAMFNYEQIQWITHQDHYEGLKGAAAYVGFNAGNTTRTFEFRPYSQNPRISYLTTRGWGNGLKGRHFFQIDETVYPGSCIEKDLDPNLPDRLPLTFFPRVGSMLGGTMVNVTGPCFKPTSIITCQFENWRTQAIYRDANHVSCISPPVMYHGYIDLTVTVDESTLFLGRYYNQPPNMDEQSSIVVVGGDEEAPKDLEVKWKANRLAWDENAKITISLWGYRETADIYPHLIYIDTLADPGSLKLGQLKTKIDPALFKNRHNNGLTDITFGFIAINLTDPTILGKGVKQSPVIWSDSMPLAWYFKQQWERLYGGKDLWKGYFCNNWYKNESKMASFAMEVPQCPCTLTQAMLDRGRFSPDLECNIIDRKCDAFHRGAQHCVRSGRPSTGGSGQTCCYDDYNELIRTVDTMYGGRPSRAHPYGKHPYKIRNNIPVLSEWVHDKTPFLFCCKWQPKGENSDSCQMYNQKRSSQDCTSYKAPTVGSVYGDPHFNTFDRWNYTLNVRGEYTLVHIDSPDHKLDVQGRFEQMPRHRRTDPLINATALTAVVARDNMSSVVEFRVRPSAATWRYRMYVIVDKEYVFWWDDSMRLQSFHGVTLYQPEGIQNMSHIIAMFDSGAGVEVMTDGGQMSVNVYAPSTFMNKTAGLLGNYSNDFRNDFTLPNGQVIPVVSTQEDIHNKFGKAWRVQERVAIGDSSQASLFYHDAIPFSFYDYPDFKPDFGLPPQLPDWAKHLKPEMLEVCGQSIGCQYDYVMTFDKSFAKITKAKEDYALWLSNETHKKYIRCPSLPKPLNGRKSEARYWPGTIVGFKCDAGYKLVGNSSSRCSENGAWTHNTSPKCVKLF